MKRPLVLGLMAIIVSLPLHSQLPEGFNYQAIARDASGTEITDTGLDVMVSISNGESPGTLVWEEIHHVTTNPYGLFSLVVGDPLAQPGNPGLSSDFRSIDWSMQPLYIGIRIFYLGNWVDMGQTRLMSVPYSLLSGNLAGPVSKLSVSGDTVSPDSALFEVRNNDGEVIFAVYNHGVRINVPVDPLAKGPKGGFAIGGFDKTKGIVQDYLVVNNDSVRVYIDTNPAVKGPKGGFAIGGFDRTKAAGEEYMRVTRDSTRVYVSTPQKGPKGGFAIGGFDRTKGAGAMFMDMTPENYFIGDSSGTLTTGTYNSFIGFKAGASNAEGSYNAFFGYQSGYRNQTGSSNLFVGYQSGYNNQSGSFNSFVGYKAGYNNTTGLNNTFLGSYSATGNTTGSGNTSIGYYAGYYNSTGNENNFIGYNAGYHNSTGNQNIFVGPESGYSNTSGTGNIFTGVRAGSQSYAGNANIFIGTNAGQMFSTGSRNICIGTEAGWQSYPQANSTSDNIFIGYQAGNPGAGSEFMNSPGNGNIWIGKYAGWNLGSQWYNAYMKNGTPPIPPLMNTLVIDNNDHGAYVAPPPSGPDLTHYPLIFGNFTYELTRRCVVINGVDNHGHTFFVNGSSGGYGAWGTVSDEREKRNIRSVPDALAKVLELRGVNFEWKDSVRFGNGPQLGFIAQEAAKVIPEVVTEIDGKYSMFYGSITALLVEGMKEQQKVIENDREEIDRLRAEVSSLERRLELIEEALLTGNR